MSESIDLNPIKSYFMEKFKTFGATPRGTDWNSEASQELRFEQLLRVCSPDREFSINDYGCGWGGLINTLNKKGFHFRYMGFDLLEPMVMRAQELFKDQLNCTFTNQVADLPLADYTVASGIFNIRLQNSYETWTDYSLQILHKMDELSSIGFSFNMLTKYSDSDHMRADLYYADPGFMFDYCKTHFAKNVALLHDYGLYDFTIIVRKQL